MRPSDDAALATSDPSVVVPSLARGRGWTVPLAVTGVYAAVVVFGAMHHEPWRDEVVPLSIARQARSVAGLVAPLRFEGHPALWYVLLWGAYRAVGQTWVLKAVSLAAAIGAMLLVNRSVLPWWLRVAFTASFFPLYQYSVVSRGYVVEMLLLFAFCAAYPRRREHPLAVALVLALLANTEAFGWIMTLAAVAMLAVDQIVARDPRRLAPDVWMAVGAVIVACGAALALLTASPASTHPLAQFRDLDAMRIARAVAAAVVHPAAHATAISVLPAPSLWVWVYFLYLLPRAAVLAFAVVGLVGIELLFDVVYGPKALWHLGNVMLVLVATAWLDAASRDATGASAASLRRVRTWLGRMLAIAIAVTVGGQVPRAVRALVVDYRYDYSASPRLAALLAGDPGLANAVVMGEPDPPLWSLPYYADNRIYLAREGVYRAWGVFAPPRRVAYDLDALLAAARAVRRECDCPVVITLGWGLDAPATHTIFPDTPFEETFTIDAASRAAFLAAARPLARLAPTVTDERYDVYVLR